MIRAVAVGCALALASAKLAFAQTSTSVRISAGSEQVAQKNPAESPYIYEGTGWTTAVAVSRVSARRAFQVEATTGIAPLESSKSGGTATHLASDFTIRDLRTVGTGRWMFGGLLAASLDGSRHHYPLYVTNDNFGHLRFSLGPAARVRWNAWRGEFTNDIQAPLLSLIDFPYTDAKANGDGLQFTFAGPQRLQAVEDVLSYRAPHGIVAEYRLNALRYHFGDQRTFARQSLSVGIVVPSGARDP